MKSEVLPGLIDPDRVADVFAEGFAAIEKISGSCVRFTLYATRDFGPDVEHIVVARVVMPTTVLFNARRQTKAVMNDSPFIHAVPISAFMS